MVVEVAEEIGVRIPGGGFDEGDGHGSGVDRAEERGQGEFLAELEEHPQREVGVTRGDGFVQSEGVFGH